jgi:hypothetical protein
MQRVLFYVEEQAQKCHLLQFSMLFFQNQCYCATNAAHAAVVCAEQEDGQQNLGFMYAVQPIMFY